MLARRLTIFALAGLALAACLPVATDHPIGSTAGFKPDPALIGLWKGHGEGNGDKDGYFAFLLNGDGGMTAIMMSPDKDSGDWGTYDLKLATLGASHVMNAREISKNGKPDKPSAGEAAGEAIPLRYDIGRDGKLTLYLLDDKATAAAIKSGAIKGTIHRNSDTDSDARLTADAKSLDAFFATKQGAALFSAKLTTLTRVK